MTVQRKFSNAPIAVQLGIAVLIAVGVSLVFSLFKKPQLTGEIAFASPQYEAGDVVKVKCPFALPRFHNVECFRAIVPQNHRTLEGENISILAVKILPRGGEKVDDPFLYLEGGPGYASISRDKEAYGADGWERDRFAEILDTGRAVYLVDTRGLGLSQPSLQCPKVHDAGWAEEKKRPEARSDEAELIEAEKCFSSLQDAGVELASYNSLSAARDLKILREGLGIRQWNIYGISYGAQTALNLLNVDKAGIRTAIFDSPSYNRIDTFPADQEAFDRALGFINGMKCKNLNRNNNIPLNDKSGDNQAFRDNYLDAYQNARTAKNRCEDDLISQLEEVLNDLEKQPVPLRSHPFATPIYMGKDDAISVIHNLLYRNNGKYSLEVFIDRWRNQGRGYLASLSNASMDWHASIASSFYDDMFSWPVHFTTNCTEMNYGPSSGRSIFPAYTENDETTMRNICSLLGLSWDGREIKGDKFRSVPSIVFSGALDVITPPSYGEELAKDIEGTYYFAPVASHGVVFWSEDNCPMDKMIEFLETGQEPKLLNCIKL